jgi:serine/threonine protein kinase
MIPVAASPFPDLNVIAARAAADFFVFAVNIAPKERLELKIRKDRSKTMHVLFCLTCPFLFNALLWAMCMSFIVGDVDYFKRITHTHGKNGNRSLTNPALIAGISRLRKEGNLRLRAVTYPSQATSELCRTIMSSDKTRALGPIHNADASRFSLLSSINQGAPGVGHKLGSLCMVRQIGSGGMGIVFQARHEILQRFFAVKFLDASLVNDSELRNRFHQETLALGKLEHPNIVQPIDAGEYNGRPYLVTELLRGRDLNSIVAAEGPMAFEDTCVFVAQAAKGLQFAHQRGFVHRDIKPSNLFLCEDSSLKLIDFGLVRCSSNESELTQAGQFLGSVDFLSPEQASDPRNTDYRSDIYSLGCTWIYLLSGSTPFPDSHYPSVVAKLKGHMMDVPSWLQSSHPQIPSELLDTLRCMVAKQPTERPDSLEAILEVIQSCNSQEKSHVASPSYTSPYAAITTKSTRKPSRAVMSWLVVAAILLFVCSIGWAINRRKENMKSDFARDVAPTRSSSPSSSPSTNVGKRQESLHAGRVRNARGATLPVSKSAMDATITNTSINTSDTE